MRGFGESSQQGSTIILPASVSLLLNGCVVLALSSCWFVGVLAHVLHIIRNNADSGSKCLLFGTGVATVFAAADAGSAAAMLDAGAVDLLTSLMNKPTLSLYEKVS